MWIIIFLVLMHLVGDINRHSWSAKSWRLALSTRSNLQSCGLGRATVKVTSVWFHEITFLKRYLYLPKLQQYEGSSRQTDHHHPNAIATSGVVLHSQFGHWWVCKDHARIDRMRITMMFKSATLKADLEGCYVRPNLAFISPSCNAKRKIFGHLDLGLFEQRICLLTFPLFSAFPFGFITQVYRSKRTLLASEASLYSWSAYVAANNPRHHQNNYFWSHNNDDSCASGLWKLLEWESISLKNGGKIVKLSDDVNW